MKLLITHPLINMAGLDCDEVSSPKSQRFKSVFKSYRTYSHIPMEVAQDIRANAFADADESFEAAVAKFSGDVEKRQFEKSLALYGQMAVVQSCFRTLKKDEEREALKLSAQSCIDDLGITLPIKMAELLKCKD